MTYRAFWGAVAALGLGIVLMSIGPAAPADGDLVATVDKPAVLTVSVPALLRKDQTRQLVLDVTGFRPPSCPPGQERPDLNCTVQAVVKAASDTGAPPQEIGRFSIFPNTQFSAGYPSEAQRFGFELPEHLARAGPLKIYVYLVPSGSDSNIASKEGPLRDAWMNLGGAEID
jgi:hypothetical protein